MKGLEPQILDHLTMDAKSTTQVIIEIYGQDCNLDHARTQVHEALRALEGDGLIESRMLNTSKPTRYWALPGGRFPDGVECPLTQRILAALMDGPMTMEQLSNAVYTHAEAPDSVNSQKRLGKALNRLKGKSKVERCRGANGKMWPSTWKLVE